jgi:hypothetical protein
LNTTTTGDGAFGLPSHVLVDDLDDVLTLVLLLVLPLLVASTLPAAGDAGSAA